MKQQVLMSLVFVRAEFIRHGAGDFVESDGASWQATLDINLRAALVGTRLATQAMRRQRSQSHCAGQELTCR